MASFYDKVSMRTAITDHTKLDLSHQHITTAGWFQMNPVLLKECIPGEKVSVDLMTYSKMQSLVTPTFGRANIKLRVFKVPMHTIFRG